MPPAALLMPLYEFHQLISAFSCHERTLTPSAQKPLHEPGRRGAKPYRKAALKHIVHIVALAGSAPSAGYHHILKLPCLSQHRCLYLPECNLATFGEKTLYRGMEALLYIKVEIDELSPHGLCQCSSECRLATSHIAHKKYWPLYHFLFDISVCNAG